MFYHFAQNNTGGRFDDPAIHLIIQADTPDDANDIAQQHNVYFDGVDRYIDCDCCGDRWYPVDDSDGKDSPHVYGTPLAKWINGPYYKNVSDYGVPVVLVIYKDGRIKKY